MERATTKIKYEINTFNVSVYNYLVKERTRKFVLHDDINKYYMNIEYLENNGIKLTIYFFLLTGVSFAYPNRDGITYKIHLSILNPEHTGMQVTTLQHHTVIQRWPNIIHHEHMLCVCYSSF
jgi:hypothetical protein